MPDFFISYTAADSDWAEWVAWSLEETGFTTVIQAWDFGAGRNFVQLMDEAAKTSKRTIAILSESYLRSAFGKSEWYAAFSRDPESKQRSLIPVRVDDCNVEGLLAQITYVDLVGIDEAAAKQKLISAVTDKRTKPQLKPSFPGATTKKPKFPGASAEPAPGRHSSVLVPAARGMQKAILDNLRLEQDAAETASTRLRQTWAFIVFAALLVGWLEGAFYLGYPAHLRIPSALLIGFCLAWFIAGLIARCLTMMPAVRRWHLGAAWIEGFWHIKTFEFGSDEAEATGLVEMQFRGYPLRLQVQITKLRSAETPHPTTSSSEAALLSKNLKYWNKWCYIMGGETLTGYASGVFYKKPSTARYPNVYQGVLIFTDGRPQKMQRAEKISPSRIDEFRKEHGELWRDAMLLDLEKMDL